MGSAEIEQFCGPVKALRQCLEHVKFEIAPCCVVEDEAGKEGEAGNLIWFPMQPDAAS